MEKLISFPHLGSYHIPVECLIKLVFGDARVLPPLPITRRTLELGARYSPEFICVPFKYNLGNYIEALENGANVLFQAAGGCRFGYYGEVQEKILRDLGYEFEFIRLFDSNLNIFNVYTACKKVGCNISFSRFTYYLLLIIKMVTCIDKIEGYIRENIGFECKRGSFEGLHKSFLNTLKDVDSFKSLGNVYTEYFNKVKSLKIHKPDDCLRVGLVGELYTLMEPFSNFFIEKELAKNNILLSRFTTATYLLFKKNLKQRKILAAAGDYLKYPIGADGTESVARSIQLANKGYDGLIHVKPFGCTPEVNAMPMLQKIGRDYKIPVLYFSFDTITSETGVKTRLEAFCDMIRMRRARQRKVGYDEIGNALF